MYRIKFISQQDVLWRRQLPMWGNQWGECLFLFDKNERDYDYLVVFDDLPDKSEELACSRENTYLITTEPVSVKIYPKMFLKQFGTVITHQEPFAIDHHNPIFIQTAFPWHYGMVHGSQRNLYQWLENGKGFNDLATAECPNKKKLISTVCSNKGNKVSVFHQQRLNFTRALKERLPSLDFYGRDTVPVGDKADAIDDYKYHLVIENYICPHWWTEKLADTYLGYALPIFHGCPNLSDYFPSDSYISINMYDFESTVDTINQVMENNEYEKRLPAIKEARQRLLYEHNIFAMVDKLISSRTYISKKASKERIDSYTFEIRKNKIKLHRYYIAKWQRSKTKRKFINYIRESKSSFFHHADFSKSKFDKK